MKTIRIFFDVPENLEVKIRKAHKEELLSRSAWLRRLIAAYFAKQP